MPRPRKVRNAPAPEDEDKGTTLPVATDAPPSAGDEQEDDDTDPDEDLDDEDDGDDDDEDDEEEDDGDREDDQFDKLMARLTGAKPAQPGQPATANPGGDLGQMLVVMMMQERAQSRREAREMRREQARAKASMDRLMVSMMLKGSKPDPFMMEMFKTLAGGEQQKATFKTLMDINAENAKAQLANMKELFSSTDELKNRVFEQVLSRMEGGKDSSSGSVALDVIRELKDVAAPLIAGITAKNQPRNLPPNQARANPAPGQVPGTVPAAITGPVTGDVSASASAGAQGGPDPIRIIMRTVHHVHTHPEMTPAERRRIRSQLATVIMDVPVLADAIVEQNEQAAASAVQAYVMSDPEILAWVTGPGVADWLNNYLNTEIADVLGAMMDVEDPPGDEDEDPEGDGDGGGERQGQGQGRSVTPAPGPARAAS